MAETLIQKTEPIIKEYEELERSRTGLELENALQADYSSDFLTYGRKEKTVYYYNCSTIIVTQTLITDKEKPLDSGWQKRRFRIAGLKQNVGSIVKEIEEKGVKLREI